jgi:fibronectin type 3 domain-containing protein
LLITPVYATGFQNDYVAINEAADSMLMLVTYIDDTDEPEATGSGFIAFSSDILITNYHVVEGSLYIYAIDDDDNIYELSRVIIASQEKDIAILRFSNPTKLTPLTLDDSRSYLRGQPIVAIGSPGGVINTVSTGIISAIFEDSGISNIQFTAPISPGSSGGALFNDDGEVIGITSSYYENGQNMNYAVDIRYAVELYNAAQSIFETPLASYNWQNTGNIASSPTVTTKPTATKKPTATPTPSVTITTTEVEKPSSPTNVTAVLSSNQAVISWKAVDGAEKYYIYRSKSKTGPYVFTGWGTTNKYTDIAAIPGSTYYYKIESVVGSVLSEKSVYASVTIPNPTHSPSPTLTPHPIMQFTAEEIAQYRLLEPGCIGEDVLKARKRMYELGYYSKVPTQTEFTKAMMEYVKDFQRNNSLPETGILSQAEQAYLFSDYALPKPMPTPTPMPSPAPPQNIKATQKDGVVTVTWQATKNADKYHVYRSSSANGFYKFIGEVTTNKYIDQTPLKGKTNYYKIVSILNDVSSSKSTYGYITIPTLKPTATPYQDLDYENIMRNVSYHEGSLYNFNATVLYQIDLPEINVIRFLVYVDNDIDKKIVLDCERDSFLSSQWGDKSGNIFDGGVQQLYKDDKIIVSCVSLGGWEFPKEQETLDDLPYGFTIPYMKINEMSIFK